jgi:TetR/AcrR family transcriptional regulator, cholesterol catabolism regulator
VRMNTQRSKIRTKSLPDSEKRSKRWIQQHQKILDLAGSLFVKKGYLQTSIEDIARAAKINKAIIYHYFENKAYLLFEIVTFTLDTLTGFATQIANSNQKPKVKLENLIKNHIEWQFKHYWLSGIGYLERKNLPAELLKIYINKRDNYENIFKEIIEMGITKGEFRSCDPRLTTFFILGMINSVILWCKPSGNLPATEISSKVWEFIRHSLDAD